jgi:hypothetical protein
MRLTALRHLLPLLIIPIGVAQTALQADRTANPPAAKAPGTVARTVPPEFAQTLSTVYSGGLPIAVAGQLLAQPNAVGILGAVLDDWDSRKLWENATIVMGLSGDPRAFSKLSAFIQRDDSPLAHCPQDTNKCVDVSALVAPDVYYAKANVPTAMGLLLNRLDTKDKLPANHEQFVEHLRQEILGFLKGVHLTWHTSAFGDDESVASSLHIRLKCIDGLAISGDPLALQALNWLRDVHLPGLEKRIVTEQGRQELKALDVPTFLMDPDVVSTLHRAVDLAIQKNTRIAKEGLENYYEHLSTSLRN